MQITTRTWNNYIARLSRLNEAAGQKMREYIQLHGTENTEQLISYAYAVITRYGEGSAELACQMYDALAGKRLTTDDFAIFPLDDHGDVNPAEDVRESLPAPVADAVLKRAGLS